MTNQIRLTIFTPTFNRGVLLNRLYGSLLRQNESGFEWIVVDDGSTDNTRSLVEQWAKDSKGFSIRYFYRDHGGKHRATNYGLKVARGSLFMIVDSDDWLTDNAIEKIFRNSHYLENPDIISLQFRIMTPSGRVIGNPLPEFIVETDFAAMRERDKIEGDMAEIFDTSQFREKYPFPEFEGEYFLPEAVVWNRMALKKKVILIDEPIYYCDYQPDGLSSRIVRLRHESPVGAMICYSELLANTDIPIKRRIRASINFWRFAKPGTSLGDPQALIGRNWIWTKPFGRLLKNIDFVKKKNRPTESSFNYEKSPLVTTPANNLEEDKNQEKRTIKVLHVITSLATGGVEKLMVDLISIQRKKGIDAQIFVFERTVTPILQKLKDLGVPVIFSDRGRSVYNPLHIISLRRLIEGYDIIHTHNSSPQFFAVLAAIGTGKILVTTEHNTYNRRRGWKWFRPIDKIMYRQYKSIICVSQEVNFSLRSYLPTLKNLQASTIYNGVEFNPSIWTDENPALKLRDERGAGIKIITMVASFRPQKDQDTLIKAMTQLPGEYILILVGSGVRKKECEEFSKKIGVGDRVIFAGECMNAQAIMGESDVNVLSTHYEGFGLSAVEGMASGKPFISTDAPGVREIVGDGGVLVPPGDYVRLADEIRKLTTIPEYKNENVSRGRRRALKFNLLSMVESYIELYRQLIEGKRNGTS